jgi:unsaturated rhamnogalacturonyl hydrolase
LTPGAGAEVKVWVRNFRSSRQRHRIEFHAPPGLQVEPAALEGELAGESRRAFPVRVTSTAQATPGANLVGLDVTLDGRRYGQWFDFVVGIAPRNDEAARTPAVPQPAALVKTVADAVLRDFPDPPPFDWGEGVLLTGMMHAHRLTKDARYLDFVRCFADHWAERGLEPVLSAKGYCGHWGPAFPMWLLYETTREERHARLAEQVIDFMLHRAERTRDGGLSHFNSKVQLWVDTLDMVCPVLSHGSRIRGQPAWQAESVRQFDLFARYLQDPQTRLWVHLWDEASAQKTTAFWARGDGWVVLSLIEILRNEPPDSANAPRLRQVLTQLLAALVKRQDPASGLWHTVLDAPDTPLETSASAMFLYGLAESRRLKLDGSAPEDALKKAWAGLAKQVNAQGRVVGVSAGTIPGDKARYAARPLGSHPWGTGAFLMAAAALAEKR